MKSPRQAAVAILRAWPEGHTYAENLIDQSASRYGYQVSDRALLNAVITGVIRNLRLLDHWIGRLRDGRVDPATRDVLRIGLCQLLILKLPDHAAVFETVELAAKPARGLVNAVMRRAAATKEELLSLVDLPPAVKFSHPDWLYDRWKVRFGESDTLALMHFNNQPAPVIARLNPLVPTPDFPPNPELPEGFLRIEGPVPQELVSSGSIYIQDPATRLSVDLLAPLPGESILDACAAPGGKSFLIAAALGGGAGLTCTDSNSKRLPRLRENLERLRIYDTSVLRHDWSDPAPAEWQGKFDAILLDVPCSNTGVMRRRIDVRWRLKPDDIPSLTQLQRRIFAHALPCLKPGGRIVYSTCSIEDEENDGQIAAILSEFPGLKLEATARALPHRDGTDGAFAALLRSS